MPNPLFNALSGGSVPVGNDGSNYPSTTSQQPVTPSNGPQMTMQDAMRQLQSNTAEMIRQAGYNVPDEIANDPRAAAMHIIQSGQVRSPVMQRIQPMLNMLMGRR